MYASRHVSKKPASAATLPMSEGIQSHMVPRPVDVVAAAVDIAVFGLDSHDVIDPIISM